MKNEKLMLIFAFGAKIFILFDLNFHAGALGGETLQLNCVVKAEITTLGGDSIFNLLCVDAHIKSAVGGLINAEKSLSLGDNEKGCKGAAALYRYAFGSFFIK